MAFLFISLNNKVRRIIRFVHIYVSFFKDSAWYQQNITSALEWNMNQSKENGFLTVDDVTIGSIMGEIIHNSGNLILFSFGTFIQVKIISTCRKEKHNTWKIAISHSVVMMALFFFGIMFEKLTHYFPAFPEYTVSWMC